VDSSTEPAHREQTYSKHNIGDEEVGEHRALPSTKKGRDLITRR
jgi:hypothetical protein